MIWFCGVMPYSWSSKWYGDGVKKVVMFDSVKNKQSIIYNYNTYLLIDYKCNLKLYKCII